jgi:hypothetical protein
VKSAAAREALAYGRRTAAARLFGVLCLLALVALAIGGSCAQGASAQVAPPVVVKQPVSLNVSYRNLALAQGPLDFASWPLPAFSGQTGAEVPTTGVQAYGWCFRDLVGLPGVEEASVQCFAAREAFWLQAPSRSSTYETGSLPTGFLPSPLAFAGVTGPDASHFPIRILVDLYDANDLVATPSGPKPAKVAIGPMLRALGAAHAGMLRKLDGSLVSWIFDDRSATYFLRTLVDLGQRGLLNAEDAATLRAYIDTRLLPWWETDAWQYGGAGKGAEGGDTLQWFNGGAWLGPALYDYIKLLPPSKIRARHYAILQTICVRALLLQATVPGKALQTERVTTWDGLTAAGVTTAWYYGCWSERIWRVTDRVMVAPWMSVAADGQAALCTATLPCPWHVDADGVPLP